MKRLLSFLALIVFYLSLSLFAQSRFFQKIGIHQDSTLTGFIHRTSKNSLFLIFIPDTYQPSNSNRISYISNSTDNGLTWSQPKVFRNDSTNFFYDYQISSIRTLSNKILIAYSTSTGLHVISSSNNGKSWTTPQRFHAPGFRYQIQLSQTIDGTIYISFERFVRNIIYFIGIYNPIDLNNNGFWDPDEDMPDFLGDVTYWCVYNDGMRSLDRRFATVNPLDIEIKQTIFASEKNSYLRNTFFVWYSIVNKGTVNPLLKDVIFTVFADPDIGDYVDDLIGSDTLLQSSFAYNNSTDLEFGVNPPSLFITLLQGPIIYTGNSTDTAFNKKEKILGEEIFPNYINLKVSSIYNAIYSSPIDDPLINNVIEFRNYALGKLKNGNIVNPCTYAIGRVLGGIDCNKINPFFF